MIAPQRNDIERLLQFGRSMMRSRSQGRLLIHCHAGLSRSTAAAVLLLAQAQLDRPPEAAVSRMLEIRPNAWPKSSNDRAWRRVAPLRRETDRRSATALLPFGPALSSDRARAGGRKAFTGVKQSWQMVVLPPGPRSKNIAMINVLRDACSYYARCVQRFGDPFTLPTPFGQLVMTGRPGISTVYSAEPNPSRLSWKAGTLSWPHVVDAVQRTTADPTPTGAYAVLQPLVAHRALCDHVGYCREICRRTEAGQ